MLLECATEQNNVICMRYGFYVYTFVVFLREKLNFIRTKIVVQSELKPR